MLAIEYFREKLILSHHFPFNNGRRPRFNLLFFLWLQWSTASSAEDTAPKKGEA